MKKYVILLLCVLPGITATQAQSRLKLADAVKKGFVKLHIMGAGGYSGKCAEMETENVTSQSLDIDIDSGQKIQCSDSSAQNLIVTQSEHVRLAPKRKVKTALYAMCINAHKGSPGKVLFSLGAMAQGSLLRLVQFIEQKKWQNNHAQSAVWSITDNKDIASIGESVSQDADMINALRGFVAKEKHIASYPKATPKVRAIHFNEGSEDLILQKKAMVEVLLLDKNNAVKKQLMSGQKEAGILRVNYSIKNTDYLAGRYFLVIKVNGKEEKRVLIYLE